LKGKKNREFKNKRQMLKLDKRVSIWDQQILDQDAQFNEGERQKAEDYRAYSKEVERANRRIMDEQERTKLQLRLAERANSKSIDYDANAVRLAKRVMQRKHSAEINRL
jgi:hypothetical protein